MALAPDPSDERRRQQRIAPAPSGEARERTSAERVAADFGLTVLDDGSYAKAQTNGKVGHALSVPAEWGEDDQPIAAPIRRRHRTAVREFTANVKRDRVARARAPHPILLQRPQTGRHEARPGVTRRTSSSSRSSGQDPSDPSDESEASAPRRCGAPWCDRPVYGASQKRYCGHDRCDRARAEERQRTHRHSDLTAQERERLDDARRAGYVGDEAFAGPEKHALSFLWKHDLVVGFDPGELEALLNRPACRCNGHHIDGGVVGCFKCGLSARR